MRVDRRCTSRSLPSVYSVETVHFGLARPWVGPVVMVTISSPTCMQRCTGGCATSFFACCGNFDCTKGEVRNQIKKLSPDLNVSLMSWCMLGSTVVLLVFCFSTAVCKDLFTQSLQLGHDLSATDFLFLV